MKSFVIQYSKDNVIWNKILDDSGRPKEFLANVDAESEKLNLFKTPINAQFMKIQPQKWNSAIELKVEPLGCFMPYREYGKFENCFKIFRISISIRQQ